LHFYFKKPGYTLTNQDMLKKIGILPGYCI